MPVAVRDLPDQISARRRPGNPEGELEALAAALLTVPSGVVPELRRTPAFARRVEAVRQQLIVAWSCTVLAGSFGREAGRLGPATPGAARRTQAIRAAYAIRWLELLSGAALPAWSVWLGGTAWGTHASPPRSTPALPRRPAGPSRGRLHRAVSETATQR